MATISPSEVVSLDPEILSGVPRFGEQRSERGTRSGALRETPKLRLQAS